MVRNKTVPMQLESLANELIEIGVPFIAIPERPLAEGGIELLTLRFSDGLDELMRDSKDIASVSVDGHEFDFYGISDVLHSEVHLQQRIPLYTKAHSRLGLPETSLDEGLAKFRDYRARGHAPSPATSPVSLEALIDAFVREGAAAVSLQKELIELMDVDSITLPFRAHMSPATGHEIAGQYETVSVGDSMYSFSVEPVLGGPEFYGKVPVYASDDIIGMEPVPVEEGIQNIQHYLSQLTTE